MGTKAGGAARRFQAPAAPTPKKQIPITYHHHLTLSTHPATEERLDELRREMASLTGSWRPLSVDMAAAKAALPATP